MCEYLQDNVLYSSDIVRLNSGEIMSLYGSFDGDRFLGRLSFYPSRHGDRMVNGIRYNKAYYETNYVITGCKKIFNHPGEQLFIISRAQIKNHYRPVNAFTLVNSDVEKRCSDFIELLCGACHLKANQHGLTGSGAWGALLPSSDFDWVLYNVNPLVIKRFISSCQAITLEPTFSMDHVYRKYSVFTNLRRRDMEILFYGRWHYFHFEELHISLTFVSTTKRADAFLYPLECREKIFVQGEVVNANGCYGLPRIIHVNTMGKKWKVFTWSYLYEGAFQKGNKVSVNGTLCSINGSQYILVGGLQDFIRKIT